MPYWILDFGCWKLDIWILEMAIAGPRCDRLLRPWTLSDNWQQVERKKVPQGSTRGEKVPQGSAIRKIGSTSIQKARTLRAHPFNM